MKKIYNVLLILFIFTCESNAAKLKSDILICEDYESMLEINNAILRNDKNAGSHLIDIKKCIGIPSGIDYSLINRVGDVVKLRVTIKGEDMIIWSLGRYID